MEPRYRTLIVALVPQMRQMPPPPFRKEDLQQIFAEVIQDFPYQGFGFTPNQRGAQFNNGPEDLVEIRPAAFQIQAQMDGADVLTSPMAVDKVARIFGIAAERLNVHEFIQCAIQVIAAVDAPDRDAKTFVATQLLRDKERAAEAELGDDYFVGAVSFRQLAEPPGEDEVSIQPDVNDNSLLYIEYKKSRVATAGPITLEQMSMWITEAFEFLSGPTMRLLSR